MQPQNPVFSKESSEQFGDVKSTRNMEQGDGFISPDLVLPPSCADHEQIVVSLHEDDEFKSKHQLNPLNESQKIMP